MKATWVSLVFTFFLSPHVFNFIGKLLSFPIEQRTSTNVTSIELVRWSNFIAGTKAECSSLMRDCFVISMVRRDVTFRTTARSLHRISILDDADWLGESNSHEHNQFQLIEQLRGWSIFRMSELPVDMFQHRDRWAIFPYVCFVIVSCALLSMQVPIILKNGSRVNTVEWSWLSLLDTSLSLHYHEMTNNVDYRSTWRKVCFWGYLFLVHKWGMTYKALWSL
jgi:hypothetical protein